MRLSLIVSLSAIDVAALSQITTRVVATVFPRNAMPAALNSQAVTIVVKYAGQILYLSTNYALNCEKYWNLLSPT